MSLHVLDSTHIERLARRAAGWLASRGLRRGDRVAVAGANHPRLLVLTHGALRSGIIPVIVRPYLAAAERAWVLRDAEPALVVEDAAAAPIDDAPEAEIAPLPLGRPMLYTSGTTGWPKGVWSGVLSEDLARAWAEDEEDLWAPAPGAAFLVCTPLHHSAGHRAATAALLAGARVLLLEHFDAATAVRLMAEEPVTGTFLVPTQMRRILALGDAPPPRALRRALHAGEPCPDALKRRALEWFPAGTLWEFYGSTEGQFTATSPEEWLARPGSVGRARRGRRLEVDDPDAGGVGTVYVTAPPFARWEYWRDAERTAEAWRGDAFTVGDLGRLDADGYLSLAARREDLIISGGVNVYPAEVERVLQEHPDVAEAAVFGVPDPDWGQRVCAAVVANAERVKEIEAWCRTRLDGARRPKELFAVEEIPRTSTGKVDRGALRDLLVR